MHNPKKNRYNKQKWIEKLIRQEHHQQNVRGSHIKQWTKVQGGVFVK